MTKALKFFQQKPTAPSRNSVILLISVLVIGSALVVLNSEDIYLSNKNRATVSLPDQLLAEQLVPACIRCAPKLVEHAEVRLLHSHR